MENLMHGRQCAKVHIDYHRDAQTLSESHCILHLASEGSRFPSNVYLSQNILASFLQLYGCQAPQQKQDVPICKCS